MSLVKEIRFPVRGDDRGSLIALESNRNIPFDIKRTYYIFGTKQDVVRGFHAHKTLDQVAVCVSGQCQMLLDNGKEKAEIWLNSPDKGVAVEHMVWHEMRHFSPDCVLLVLASDYYDESDYIRDYQDFLKQAVI